MGGQGTPSATTAKGPDHFALTAVLTPTIIGLIGFFALLSLSGSGISNFAVVALIGAFCTPLSAANLALTGILARRRSMCCWEVLSPDLTRRHAEVAAFGYAINACIVLAIGTMGLGVVPLVVAMCCAGLLGGLIMSSAESVSTGSGGRWREFGRRACRHGQTASGRRLLRRLWVRKRQGTRCVTALGSTRL